MANQSEGYEKAYCEMVPRMAATETLLRKIILMAKRPDAPQACRDIVTEIVKFLGGRHDRQTNV